MPAAWCNSGFISPNPARNSSRIKTGIWKSPAEPALPVSSWIFRSVRCRPTSPPNPTGATWPGASGNRPRPRRIYTPTERRGNVAFRGARPWCWAAVLPKRSRAFAARAGLPSSPTVMLPVPLPGAFRKST